jgi:hypothetical protein
VAEHRIGASGADSDGQTSLWLVHLAGRRGSGACILRTRASAPRRALGLVSPRGLALTATLTASQVSFIAVTTVSASTLNGLDVLLVDASPGNTAGLAAVSAGASALAAWISAGGFASPNDAAAPLAYDRNESTRWSSNALQTPGMY